MIIETWKEGSFRLSEHRETTKRRKPQKNVQEIREGLNGIDQKSKVEELRKQIEKTITAEIMIEKSKKKSRKRFDKECQEKI